MCNLLFGRNTDDVDNVLRRCKLVCKGITMCILSIIAVLTVEQYFIITKWNLQKEQEPPEMIVVDGSDLNITIPDKEIVRLTLEVLSAPESITDASIYSTLTGKTSNDSDVCYKSSDFAENVHLTTKETHPAVIHHLRILLPPGYILDEPAAAKFEKDCNCVNTYASSN
ncbi:uncharacterized protein LOC142341297 [Convolutriloba macropyga]|uniref:uncharacterized protein LOC142341297 n=1 Tax=Convolutriloba macropyga TaxID=536237 RepID=UPI003F528E96